MEPIRLSGDENSCDQKKNKKIGEEIRKDENVNDTEGVENNRT